MNKHYLKGSLSCLYRFFFVFFLEKSLCFPIAHHFSHFYSWSFQTSHIVFYYIALLYERSNYSFFIFSSFQKNELLRHLFLAVPKLSSLKKTPSYVSSVELGCHLSFHMSFSLTNHTILFPTMFFSVQNDLKTSLNILNK